jgi:glycosyltransferase involved in cell wall biosynthesis
LEASSETESVSGSCRDAARIAIVDEEFPYPANSGKRLRTINLLQRLAPHFNITYLAHQNADETESRRAQQYLQRLGIQTIEVSRKVPSKKGAKFYARLFANLFSSLPYSVVTHASTRMLLQLEQLRESNEIKLWHCEWTPYVELFRHLDCRPLVISAHNVESVIWRRYVEAESNSIARWYMRHQWKKFDRFERWAFKRASRLIMVSEEDATIATDSFGATNVDIVENGVDVQSYASIGSARHPKTMVFVGSLDWRPNLDGILHFIKHVFPRVKLAEPDTILEIVGRNPASWLVDVIKNHPDIRLHSNVPDVVPYLSSAGMMIVPLRIGSGSRLKIIEAAANGLPVVSTKIGAEGLAFVDGVHCHIVDRIEDLAEPIIQVMRDAGPSRQMAAEARKLVDSQYHWDTLAEKLAEVWQSAICNSR